MKKYPLLNSLFAAAALLFLATLFCHAGDAPKETKQHENRFLFILDTSSSMRACSNAVAHGVVELLESDMRGELREGDTIGFWTYNDKLDADYPMQIWSKADKSAIVESAATFLLGRRYSKKAHFEKVTPALGQVVRNSHRITVLLISDAIGLVQGTPFDREISQLQKQYARELRAARTPFVIVLAARDGTVFDYKINDADYIAVPHTATPEKVVGTNAPIAVVIPPKPVTNAPAPPPPTHSIIMIAASNAVQAAAPPPAVVTPPVAPRPQPQPQPAPPVVVLPVPASPPVAVVAPSPAPPQPAPASQPAAAPQTPEPVSETPAPQPAPVSVTANNEQPPPVAPVARNAPVANAAPSSGTQLALFIMAFSLLTIAVVLVVFLVRRSRSASHSSLISQSMDRPPR